MSGWRILGLPDKGSSIQGIQYDHDFFLQAIMFIVLRMNSPTGPI